MEKKNLVCGDSGPEKENPVLTTELVAERNEGISAQDVTTKRLWWRCVNGHIWPATICDCRRRANCPHCSGGGPIAGKQDQQ